MMQVDTSKIIMIVKHTNLTGREYAGYEGLLLSSVDFDANDGYGTVSFTCDWTEAKLFSTVDEAEEFVSSPSPIRPLVDGIPWCPAEGWEYTGVRLAELLDALAADAMDDDSTRH